VHIDEDIAKSRQRLVILVDADEQSRLVCRSGLSQAGFEVITASDAATALLVARLTAPDFIVLDADHAARLRDPATVERIVIKPADPQRLLELVGGSLVSA
jgi:ActR/RegA family two-component response regulator